MSQNGWQGHQVPDPQQWQAQPQFQGQQWTDPGYGQQPQQGYAGHPGYGGAQGYPAQPGYEQWQQSQLAQQGGWAGQPPAPAQGQIPVGWMFIGILFRLAIAALALWSFFSIVWGIPMEFLPAVIGQFSLLQVLLAGIVTALAVFRPLLPAASLQRRFEGKLGWARGMSTLYSICTLLVFGFLMGGFGDTRVAWNVLHFLVPSLMLLDFLLFGQNQEKLPWWMPFAWLVPMFAYLGWALLEASQGRPIYSFLDPDNSDFLMWIGILFAGWLVLGFVLVGLGRIRGAIRRSGTSGMPPGAYA